MPNILLVTRKETQVPEDLRNCLEEISRAQGFTLTEDPEAPDIKAIVVLGGDGTLLRSAPLAYRLDVPLLGINLGRLGFLTEITQEEACEAFESLLKGDFQVENRLLLEVEHRGEKFLVLNEAAILKGPLGHMIHLRVDVDDSLLTVYHGDGLIISTPTGSTAYNLSAGGPIVHPTSEVVILTPVCPFMLSARPVVIPADLRLQASLKEEAEDVHLILDGYVNRTLVWGEQVVIRKAEKPLRLVRSPKRDYFGILRAKLGWGHSQL